MFERENEEEAYSFMKNNDRSFALLARKRDLQRSIIIILILIAAIPALSAIVAVAKVDTYYSYSRVYDTIMRHYFYSTMATASSSPSAIPSSSASSISSSSFSSSSAIATSTTHSPRKNI